VRAGEAKEKRFIVEYRYLVVFNVYFIDIPGFNRIYFPIYLLFFIFIYKLIYFMISNIYERN